MRRFGIALVLAVLACLLRKVTPRPAAAVMTDDDLSTLTYGSGDAEVIHWYGYNVTFNDDVWHNG